jgi:hypothetical protein
MSMKNPPGLRERLGRRQTTSRRAISTTGLRPKAEFAKGGLDAMEQQLASGGTGGSGSRWRRGGSGS